MHPYSGRISISTLISSDVILYPIDHLVMNTFFQA